MELHEALKPREIEILLLMADGHSNAEIASHLHIAVETVRWYAKQIYSKLDVSGRDTAAEKAQALGLLNTRQSDEPPTAQPRHNLPTPLTSFVGRERQIDDLTRLLPTTRLLTLTGPGGIGKTRLGLQVARQWADRFADGVYFVGLAPITESAAVANTIAHTLHIVESDDQPIVEALKAALRQREVLLMLDNFEHVMDAALMVAELLASTDSLRIIVTSREALRISGEQVYPVPPMSLTDNGQSERSESVALFAQRAQAVKPHFELDAATQNAVTQICHRLDGIPLAIELAAACARFLTPDALLARLERRFDSLKSGARDAPARQQTLRSTIDWSYDLLAPDEKRLFARLAVFRSGASLDAIAAVCGNDLAADVIDSLAALVDKSMIRHLEDINGEPRFVMFETIHEYARERLEESHETEAMQHKHARFFADLTAHAPTYLRQAGYEYWFERLGIEHDNIRAALAWSLAGGDAEFGLRLVADLRDFWFYQGYHVEGQQWAEKALAHLDKAETLLQAGVLMTAGALASARQEHQASVAHYEQALARARQTGAAHTTAWALIFLAQSLHSASMRSQDAYAAALRTCEEGLAIFRTLEDNVGLAQGLNRLGNIHGVQGQLAFAKSAYEACLSICRQTGERRRELMTLANLSLMAVEMGQHEEARQMACAVVRLSQQLNFTYVTVLELGYTIPANLVTMGRPEHAARLLGASAALQEAMNIRQQPVNVPFVERTESRVRQQLGDAAFQSAYDAGRRLSLEEAVAFALKELEP